VPPDSDIQVTSNTIIVPELDESCQQEISRKAEFWNKVSTVRLQLTSAYEQIWEKDVRAFCFRVG